MTIEVSRDAEEMASALLFDLGATAIVLSDETPNALKLTACFDDGQDVQRIVAKIRAECARLGRSDGLRGISVVLVPDQDWMQKWKEGFEPFEVGNRFVVAPSWKLPPDPGDRLVIQIDPGMAFGTGTHETTRLCLEAIERHWRGGRFLDVGTGTGILAIAAALLAPDAQIMAIDADPLAIEVARENARINRVLDRIRIDPAPCRALPAFASDVVVANLTADVILTLLDDLCERLAPAGVLILSGILVSQSGEAEEALRKARLAQIERRDAGEWSALVATRATPVIPPIPAAGG